TPSMWSNERFSIITMTIVSFSLSDFTGIPSPRLRTREIKLEGVRGRWLHPRAREESRFDRPRSVRRDIDPRGRVGAHAGSRESSMRDTERRWSRFSTLRDRRPREALHPHRSLFGVEGERPRALPRRLVAARRDP